MISVVGWHKVHFSFALYYKSLKPICSQNWRNYFFFSCFLYMLRFDCTQLLWILYFTKWSNSTLCLPWLLALCAPDLLQTLISHMPWDGLWKISWCHFTGSRLWRPGHKSQLVSDLKRRCGLWVKRMVIRIWRDRAMPWVAFVQFHQDTVLFLSLVSYDT